MTHLEETVFSAVRRYYNQDIWLRVETLNELITQVESTSFNCDGTITLNFSGGIQLTIMHESFLWCSEKKEKIYWQIVKAKLFDGEKRVFSNKQQSNSVVL